MKARILVADDENILRRNLVTILNMQGYEAVGARSVREAIRRLERGRVDLVITDLVMPERGGEALFSYLSEHYPDLPVIVITAYPSADSAIKAVKRGAADYFTKPFAVPELLEAVRRALELRQATPFRWERLKARGVTRREEEVLRLMIEGKVASTKALAHHLSVKPTTVERHLRNLFAKFEVNSKTALLAAAVEVLKG
jgi:DNA-binding NarL/FixJ family response regulator